MKVVNFDISAN